MHRLTARVRVGAVRFAFVTVVPVPVEDEEDVAVVVDQLVPDLHGRVDARVAAHCGVRAAPTGRDEPVGGDDGAPVRVRVEYLLRPVEGVVRRFEFEVDQDEVHAACGQQAEVVLVLAVDGVRPEQILAEVSAV